MRKPTFCICENKDADQLISAFVFATYNYSKIPLLSKAKISSLSPSSIAVEPGPGRKPDRWVSHDAAHLVTLEVPNTAIVIS